MNIQGLLVIALSGLSASIFFSQSGTDIFGGLSLFLLLIWRFYIKHEKTGQLPKTLIVVVLLFLFNIFLSAIHSDNHAAGFIELKKYWPVFLGGLLFTCPLTAENRWKVTFILFAAAALSGFHGIFQYYGIMFPREWRAHGFTHPVHFAETLSLVYASALMLMVISTKGLFSKSNKEFYFLVFVILSTLGGIIFSLTRGVWIALTAASIIVMYMYDKRKALLLTLCLIISAGLIFSLSSTLRQRTVSIVSSVSAEDETGSTGNRLELWKGALIIFKKSPLSGTGVGDFSADIDGLIDRGEIKKILIRGHGHNVFLHSLATQGIAGIIMLLLLFEELMRWGLVEIKKDNARGYIITLSTLLMLLEGLTSNNIGISKFIAAYCLTVGLLGREGFKQKMHNEKN